MPLPKFRFVFVSQAYKIEKNPSYLGSVALGLKHVVWLFPSTLVEAIGMPILKTLKAILLLPLILIAFLVTRVILLVAAFSGRLSPIETERFVSAFPPLSEVESRDINSSLNDSQR